MTKTPAGDGKAIKGPTFEPPGLTPLLGVEPRTPTRPSNDQPRDDQLSLTLKGNRLAGRLLHGESP